MRIAPALILFGLLAAPAEAWEASTDAHLCVLSHADAQAQLRLTYDPTIPEYTITLIAEAPWPEAPTFSMRFDGPRPIVIATDRHHLSDDLTALTVRDRGFGNVLDGLQYNLRAISTSGTTSLTTDLTGAATEVAAFRSCAEAPAA